MIQELYLDGYRVDFKDKKVAFTKQFKLIENLEKEVCDFTNSVEIPFTANNLKIFEHCNTLISTSDKLYSKIPAEYIVNGVALIKDGYAIITKINKHSFDISLYQNKLNFFDQLKNNTLNDIGIYEVFTYDFATVRDGAVDGDVKFLPMDYTAGTGGCEISGANVVIDVRAMIPSCSVGYLVDKIAEYTGITINKNNITDEMWLTCSSFNLKNSPVFRGDIDGTQLISEFGTQPTFKIKPGSNSSGTYTFVCPQTGSYNFSYGFLYQSAESDTLTMNLLVNDVAISSGLDRGIEASEFDKAPVYGIFTNVLLLAGDEVRMTITKANPLNGVAVKKITQYDNYDSFYLSSYGLTNLNYLQTVNLGNILPPLKLDEFIKAILWVNGAIIKEENKEVTFYRLDDYFVNEVEDWSDKFVRLDEIETDCGYAAINKFLYKKDEEGNPYSVGDAYLTVDNEIIDKEKTILTMPVAGCSTRANIGTSDYTTGFCIANYYIKNNGTGIYDFQSKSQPRLFKRALYNSNTLIKLTDGTNNFIINKGQALVACFANNIPSELTPNLSESLDFNWVLANKYELVQTILSESKKVTAYFLLSENDFKLDIQPVYIQYLNSYFYVNKIVDFIPGQLTKVEMYKVLLSPPPAFNTVRYLQAEDGQYILTEAGQKIQIEP